MNNSDVGVTDPAYARGPEPLENVIITHELSRRPARRPDFEAENKALYELSSLLSVSAALALNGLVQEAKTLCGADAAGVSIAEVEDGKPIFRWLATSGTMEPFLQGVMPRDFSPCGVVCSRNTPVLMRDMIRHYQYVEILKVPLYEVLLVPFFQEGKSVGTVWLVSHGPHKEFDSEDLRILQNLAQFTSGVALSYFQMAKMRELVKKVETEQEAYENFVLALTHDLRNPLASAKLSTQLLEKLTQDPALLSNTKRILNGISKAETLINDILDANKLTVGKMITLKKSKIDLCALVRKTATELIQLHGREIETEVSLESMWGHFDPLALRRLIENLAENAIKYGTKDTPVRITLKKVNERAEIQVLNYGAVIAADDLSMVFRRYKRTESAISSGKKGWGIGLSIVRGITEAHEGSVAVSSNLVDGTLFTVSIPL